MCKVFQDGGRANRNTHRILILGRKYEEFFVVLLSFLHNAIYSINYIHSVVTLFKEIHVRLTINKLLTFKTFLQQNYCENVNQNNDQYSRSLIKRPLSCITREMRSIMGRARAGYDGSVLLSDSISSKRIDLKTL